jgi:pimeloyl-ACP methyl ester carboxylesterase
MSTKVGGPAEIDHGYAEFKGIKLHYAIAGEGDPVVLLHGWPTSSLLWEKEMPLLADRYTVIAPDLRGLGSSTKIPTGYDTNNLADDIHELVKSLGFRDIFLAGHDWGGAISYSYAAQFREEVRRLSIIEMIMPGFDEFDFWMKAEPDGEYFWEMHFHTLPEIPGRLISGHEEEYLNFYFENYAFNRAAVTQDKMQPYFANMRAIGNPNASLGFYRDLFKSAEQNTEHRKRKLEMPVLALGTEACMHKTVITNCEEAATNVRGEVIEKCGHWITYERPGLLAKKLGDFFDEEG